MIFGIVHNIRIRYCPSAFYTRTYNVSEKYPNIQVPATNKRVMGSCACIFFFFFFFFLISHMNANFPFPYHSNSLYVLIYIPRIHAQIVLTYCRNYKIFKGCTVQYICCIICTCSLTACCHYFITPVIRLVSPRP